MPRLSFAQQSVLVEIAKSGSWSAAKRYANANRRTIRSVQDRLQLVRFDDGLAKYVVTEAGKMALIEHGFETDGTWRGSNAPRRYR